MSETPTTTTSQKSIAIHLLHLYRNMPPISIAVLLVPLGSKEKGNTVSTPPICIAVHLPFVLQYASHSYRSTFEKILVVVVTGMFPKGYYGFGKGRASLVNLRFSLKGGFLRRVVKNALQKVLRRVLSRLNCFQH